MNMNSKHIFCEYCKEQREYKVIEKEIVNILDGREYSYTGKNAICNNCGNEIYTHETFDYNGSLFQKVYRENNDIILIEDLEELLIKYDIGKRPVSQLLGWGETTYTRYVDGDIPQKRYNDELIKIYNEPKYYLELLRKNKDNITETAYEKSEKAVLDVIEQINNQLIDNNDISIIIKYIISKNEDITNLALQKLLYFTQGFYFMFCGKFAFNNDCEAWEHGPVYKEVYNKFYKYGYKPIKESYEQDTEIVNLEYKLEIVVDSVLKYFGCYGGKILEEITHKETPWIKSRGDLKNYQPSNVKISKHLISEYFTEVKEKNNMKQISDMERYSKEMFDLVK